MSYWAFIRAHFRFLTFGFLLVFVGNFGQTFFLSLFGGHWREAFDLSHTQYGVYYSAATLASGFLILFVGARLDSAPLKMFTLWVVSGIILASLVLACAVHSAMLLLGFFLIRFCGQGLSLHVAFVSMARYFHQHRGKAISVAALGMPVGEFILPLLLAVSMAAFGWRASWYIVAAVVAFSFLPLLWWSLNTDSVVGNKSGNEQKAPVDKENNPVQWRRDQVLKDTRFWCAVPAILSPATLITGLFFHQPYWAEIRGWALSSMAASMMLYATSHALGSFATGALVDKWGARKMIRIYLIPIGLAVLCLHTYSLWGWVAFMTLSGLTVGASGPVIGSLWPEVYGIKHLGSIRSLVSSLLVVSTSIAPIVLGLLIDMGTSVDRIMNLLLAYSVICILICQRIYRIV